MAMAMAVAMSAKQAHTSHQDDIAAGRDRCCCIVSGCFKSCSAKQLHNIYEIQRHVREVHKNEHEQLQGRFPYELVPFRSLAENRKLEEDSINSQLAGSMELLNLETQSTVNVPVSSTTPSQPTTPFSGTFAMSNSTSRQFTQLTLLPSKNTAHSTFLGSPASSSHHQQAQSLNHSAHFPNNNMSNNNMSNNVMFNNNMSNTNEDNKLEGLSQATLELARVIPNEIGAGKPDLTITEQLEVVETAKAYIEDIDEGQHKIAQKIQALTQQLRKAEQESRRGRWAIELLREGGVVSFNSPNLVLERD